MLMPWLCSVQSQSPCNTQRPPGIWSCSPSSRHCISQHPGFHSCVTFCSSPKLPLLPHINAEHGRFQEVLGTDQLSWCSWPPGLDSHVGVQMRLSLVYRAMVAAAIKCVGRDEMRKGILGHGSSEISMV